MLRWCKTVLVTFVVLLLVGCSGTTFVYNRLDFLLPWYVDDYAELNADQETYLNELLSPFLVWHRAQELPDYVRILNGIETSLDKPATPEGVEATFAELEAAWLRLEGEALDWLLELGAQLSDAQIEGFLAVLWEQQEEYAEEYLDRSDEEFYEDSYQNFVDNTKDFFGTLTDQQRELLRVSSNKLLRSDATWMQGRADWFAELGVLLERQPDWQARVRAAVAARRENLSADYERIYGHNMAVIADTIAQLLNSRSERQDRHLRDKLSELRGDFETLIAEGEKTTVTTAGG